MGQEVSSRAATGLLIVALVLPLLAFTPAAIAADASLRVVNAATGASYSTIQAAIDAASAGDTITAPMGLTRAAPAVYEQSLMIQTPGITLCATVAVATCADHVEAARWSTSTGAWGTPPVAWQGQAINVGAVGSTSHFPNTPSPLGGAALQIEDIRALSFDFLLQAGTCTGGGLRAQIGLNSTGTGTTKDRTLFAYPSAPGCPVGRWVHYDLFAAENWGAVQIGGPGAGATQAQVQALAGAAHRVVTFNAIFDGAPVGTIGWFDNVRFNDAFYREQTDEACIDPEGPGCVDADARGGTILQGGCYPVMITGDGVTIRGFTIQSPGCTQVDQDFGAFDPTLVTVYASNVTIQGNTLQDSASRLAPGESRWATQAIYFDPLTGEGGRVLENTIRSIPTARNVDGTCANAPCRTVGVWAREDSVIRNNVIEGDAAGAGDAFGILVSSPGSAGFTIDGNTVTNWAHSGVYVGGSANGPGTITNNVVTGNRVNALLIEGTRPTSPIDVTGNDLRSSGSANVRIDSDRPLTLRENHLGLAGSTISFSTRFPGFGIDARYNHWSAFSRSAIDSTISDDGTGHIVDVACYYLSDGVTTVCPPTADFTMSPSTAHIHQLVSFADATTPGGNDVASRSWTFGDGTTSTAEDPTHRYVRSGIFTVTLVATDSEGFTSSASKLVAIANAAPVLDAIGARAGSENAVLAFTLHATDADGDLRSYAMAGGPVGATLHSASGAFSWKPTFDQAGAYSVTFSASDGDLTDSESVVITIADVDRAPIIGALTDPSVLSGSSTSTNVLASDPDGDAVTLTATGVPTFGTFTDLGGGAGRFDWAPLAADVGSTMVTLHASANGVLVAKTFTLTILREVNIALVRSGAATPSVSPGVVTLSATLTNHASESDTFQLRTNAPAAWAVSVPADVTLAPGASATVSVSFVMPPNAAVRVLSLTASSTATSAGARTVGWTIIEPVVLTITPDHASSRGSDAVTGVVRVTYLDETPAVGMSVSLAQTPSVAALRSSVSGATDAAGVFAFDFGLDVRSRLPGPHALVAQVLKPEPYTGAAAYVVE